MSREPHPEVVDELDRFARSFFKMNVDPDLATVLAYVTQAYEFGLIGDLKEHVKPFLPRIREATVAGIEARFSGEGS